MTRISWHLLKGDKSWSVRDFFAALEAADLEFISMLDWWSWDLMALFDHKFDELPMEIAFAFAEMSEGDRLHFYDTVQNQQHRLLDLWCGRPDQQKAFVKPIEDWTPQDWQTAIIHFHPQSLNPAFIDDMQTCAESSKMLNIANYPRLNQADEDDIALFIDGQNLGCLLLLLTGPKAFIALKQRWVQLRPLNLATGQASRLEDADRPLQAILIKLERLGYVMLERNMAEVQPKLCR
jgi:hypothetical protein